MANDKYKKIFLLINIPLVIMGMFFLIYINSNTYNYKKRIQELEEKLKEQKTSAVNKSTVENTSKTIDIIEKAKEYITKFYNIENISEKERMERIKPYLSETAYKSLLPNSKELNDNSNTNFKTYVSDLKLYINDESVTTTKVLARFNLHTTVQQRNTTTSKYLVELEINNESKVIDKQPIVTVLS